MEFGNPQIHLEELKYKLDSLGQLINILRSKLQGDQLRSYEINTFYFLDELPKSDVFWNLKTTKYNLTVQAVFCNKKKIEH